MSKQKKELSFIEKAIKLSGLGLIIIMLLAHVFYKEIDLYILLIPALMVGIDISKIIRK